jgi:hypothetical protein
MFLLAFLWWALEAAAEVADELALRFLHFLLFIGLVFGCFEVEDCFFGNIQLIAPTTRVAGFFCLGLFQLLVISVSSGLK